MPIQRLATMAVALLGAGAVLMTSVEEGRAQTPPPGTVFLPSTPPAVPPESVLPLSDVLVFTVDTEITSDNSNGALPGSEQCPDGGEPDNPAAMDLVGCGGSFSFSSVACVEVSDPEPDLPGAGLPEAGPCDVQASASYEALVCGSGYIQGSVAVDGGPDTGESGRFGIAFAGTVGVIAGSIGNDYAVGIAHVSPLASIPPPMPDAGDCSTLVSIEAALVLLDL